MHSDIGTEIEITPEMIDAGVLALEDGLLDGYSIGHFRRELVSDIYSVMRAKCQISESSLV